LYLCVFTGADEVAGVDAGAYSDFGEFRDAVHTLEKDGWGSRYPTLMNHPDGDGEWPFDEVRSLKRELSDLVGHPALQRFVDSENRPLAVAILALCDDAIRTRQPILFQ